MVQLHQRRDPATGLLTGLKPGDRWSSGYYDDIKFAYNPATGSVEERSGLRGRPLALPERTGLLAPDAPSGSEEALAPEIGPRANADPEGGSGDPSGYGPNAAGVNENPTASDVVGYVMGAIPGAGLAMNAAVTLGNIAFGRNPEQLGLLDALGIDPLGGLQGVGPEVDIGTMAGPGDPGWGAAMDQFDDFDVDPSFGDPGLDSEEAGAGSPGGPSGEHDDSEEAGAGSPEGNETSSGGMDTAGTDAESDAEGGDTDGGESVICTELHRQGLLTDEIYRIETAYGARLDPLIIDGYHLWGEPVARLMARSPVATMIVHAIVKPMVHEMAGQPGSGFSRRWGKAVLAAGKPLCRGLGRLAFLCHRQTARPRSRLLQSRSVWRSV